MTGFLLLGVFFSRLFVLLDVAEQCAPLIFLLMVFLIARWTEGYLWGVLSSVFSALLVNYVFTKPFNRFCFASVEYLVTFGTLTAVAAVTCTLTTRTKRMEERLRETEKERVRANLLRAVSHDIRTPLTAISGAVSAVLADPSLPEESRRLLRNSEEESRWLIHMVENLLAATRIGGEGFRLRKDWEAAEEIISGAAAKCRKCWPAVPVRVDAPERLLMAPMDGVLMQQVLFDLLENAVLHGGNVSELRVSVREEGEEAVFTVRDNGRGIDPDALPTLFDGVRGSAESASPDRRHMGLGLSVCKAIVTAHGGVIRAANRPEGGAVFEVRIPLKETR